MGALDRAGRFAKKAAIEVGHKAEKVFDFYKNRWTDPTIGPRLEAQRDKTKESFRKLGAQAVDTVFTRILSSIFQASSAFKKGLTAKQRGEILGDALSNALIKGPLVLLGRAGLTFGRSLWAGTRHVIAH